MCLFDYTQIENAAHAFHENNQEQSPIEIAKAEHPAHLAEALFPAQRQSLNQRAQAHRFHGQLPGRGGRIHEEVPGVQSLGRLLRIGYVRR